MSQSESGLKLSGIGDDRVYDGCVAFAQLDIRLTREVLERRKVLHGQVEQVRAARANVLAFSSHQKQAVDYTTNLGVRVELVRAELAAN